MTQSKKTDNHDPRAKLNLRRYFLHKYHSQGTANVVDCCMGSGFIWRELRKEWRISSYVGLDVKRKKGRLRIDSARYLAAGGWTHDVVDIDTYGSPWKHWVEVLRNMPASCTVFLTIGREMKGINILDNIAIRALGLEGMSVPKTIIAILSDISISYCLAMCYDYGIIPEESVEAESTSNARYVGVRLRRES